MGHSTNRAARKNLATLAELFGLMRAIDRRLTARASTFRIGACHPTPIDRSRYVARLLLLVL